MRPRRRKARASSSPYLAARPPLALLALLLLLPATARAQAGGEHAGHEMNSEMSMGMSGDALETRHMRMTPRRTPTAADSARAAAIADTLRLAIAKYRDVRAAEADGFVQFAPKVKTPRVFHFTKRANALRNELGFDPARPTSLLYTRDDAGRMTLIGAMYTAPRRSSLEELDARIPLGIAQWHLHTNICVPRPRDAERWTERRDGRPLFGPGGAIATKEACDAEGGRFREASFNWMVHANVYAPGDPWADHHRASRGR